MARFRNEFCTGVMFARDENDRIVGYQGYAIKRGKTVKGGQHQRVTIGDVHPETSEGYVAARDAVRVWAAE